MSPVCSEGLSTHVHPPPPPPPRVFRTWPLLLLPGSDSSGTDGPQLTRWMGEEQGTRGEAGAGGGGGGGGGRGLVEVRKGIYEKWSKAGVGEGVGRG